MTDMNTETIFRIASQYGLDLPAEVVEAQALHEAALAFRETVANAPRPDLSSLTVKGIPKAHAALVDHANRTAHTAAADTLVAHASEKLDLARFTTADRFASVFAGMTSDFARDLIEALTALGGTVDPLTATRSPELATAHNQLRQASSDLDAMREARTAFAFRGVRFDRDTWFEPESRMLYLVRTPGRSANFSAGDHPGGYWCAALERGHRIVWQDRAAQERNHDEWRKVPA